MYSTILTQRIQNQTNCFLALLYKLFADWLLKALNCGVLLSLSMVFFTEPNPLLSQGCRPTSTEKCHNMLFSFQNKKDLFPKRQFFADINIRLIRDYWCLTSFFMFANTHLHVTSQHHDITLTLIAIQCGSLCANCRFLETGLVDHKGVLHTPIR